MASDKKNERPVLIIGGGTFGLATAHRLSCAGYTQITVLEKDDVIPSRFSAGYDLNKIIRAEYADAFYTPLTLQAIEKWQNDPLYAAHFRQVGFLNVVSGTATQHSKSILAKYLASTSQQPIFREKIIACPDDAAIRAAVPALTGPMDGWHGYLNSLAGYAHSANAMQAVYEDCVKRGVHFRLGPREGEVESLLFEPDGGRCVGARTSGGVEHHASTIIVALGANAARIVPAANSQVTARCWGVSHIQLSPEEAASLRGIPVVNARDIGFYFEPDIATNKLKICHMGGGFTNHAASSQGISLPFPKLSDSSFVLEEDITACRRLLRETLPWLADRPFIDNHLCWFSDTQDSNYIIDYVPDTQNSLVMLAGDSGHGFKMLPIMGDFVMKLLEDGCQNIARWRWRDEESSMSLSKVAWRTGSSQDLANTPRAKI